jgi:hypothetical protein
MDLQQIYKLKEICAELLGAEPLDEAYHEKDRDAKKEIDGYLDHHGQMMTRHANMAAAETKGKELSKHDLASIAHTFALNHFSKMRDGGGAYGRLPEDYHHDREFYDKLNGMVSKRADGKSKDCGVSCDTTK